MNLIIIQANSNYKDILENRFEESEDYEVIGSTDNGEIGVNLIAYPRAYSQNRRSRNNSAHP